MNKKIFDEILTEYCQKYNVRGLSAAIHDEGENVYSFSYGVTDQTKKHKINNTTLFPIGSISKIFAVVSIMILKDEGKLELDTPIYQYIPQFKMADSRYREITVRMLLNHSSGLEGSAIRAKYCSNTSERDYLRGLIEYYTTASLKDAPGKFSVYCNDGFCLAELVVEQVSKMSFSNFVYQKICIPSKMEHTDFPIHEFREGHFSVAPSMFDRDYGQEYINGIGSGGIYSTAEDICAFFDTFITNSLLSESSLEEMNRNQVPQVLLPCVNTAYKYGLGWDCVEIESLKALSVTALGKSGATYGFKSHALVTVDEKVSCAILTCADEGKGSMITQRLAAEYLQMKLNRQLVSNHLDDLEHIVKTEKIMGLYGNNENTFRVRFSDGCLVIEVRKEHQWQSVVEDFIKTDKGYQSEQVFMGFQKPNINFIEVEQQIYLVVDYNDFAFAEVRQRVLLAQKIEMIGKDNWFYQQKDRKWIISNEYLEQRLFGIFPIVLEFDHEKGYESILLNPYPLKVKDNFEAEPFLQIPGDYSREMMHLRVLDKDVLQLGQYLYQPIEKIRLLTSKEFVIRDTFISWFEIKNEIDTVKMDGRARFVIVDKQGSCVFDSDVASKLPESLQGYWIGFIGAIGSKITIVCMDEVIEESKDEINEDLL